MKQSVLSIGNFDGLHLGHRKFISEVVATAKKLGLRSVVMTFDNHPAGVISGQKYTTLLPIKQKVRLMRELGVDEIPILHFDEEMAQTSAEDFLREDMVKAFSPAVIVMGHDSRFGSGRSGDLAFMESKQCVYGFELRVVEPLLDGERVVSSSLIRKTLAAGELAEANRLLGAPYTLYGEVESGAGLGRGLGFPTANLRLEEPLQLLPRSGVYHSRAWLDGKSFFGLTNIGTSPTVKNTGKTEVETHILDFDQQIYGKPLRVELLSFLREEKMFNSKNALLDAMREDLSQARKFVQKAEL